MPSDQRRLHIDISASTGREHAPFLRRYLLRAHAILKPPLAELSLALVGDQRMARLHRQFMNLPGPTDVLSFPLDFDARGRVLSGEVVICVPEGQRQVARRARVGRRGSRGSRDATPGGAYRLKQRRPPVNPPSRRAGIASRRTTRSEVSRELLLYALHGMMHLCGFDDTTPDAFHEMHRTEDDILLRLGVGKTFEPDARGAI